MLMLTFAIHTCLEKNNFASLSPLWLIPIMYTGVPLVFSRTGSHSSMMEPKVVFVTVGMPGAGDMEPSPARMDEKFFKCVRNLQLAPQLIEVF